MKKHSSLMRFILLILVSACAGGAFSLLILQGEEAVRWGCAWVGFWLCIGYLPVQLAMGIFVSAWAFRDHRKALALAADLEDESAFEKADALLNRISILTSTCTALSIAHFGVFALQAAATLDVPLIFTGIAAFLTVTLTMVYWEVKTVRLMKRLNPEKRGDPLETRFVKDWLQSCDEAERYIIYNASYRTFQVMRIVLLSAWLVAMLGGYYLDAGILPALLVGALYVVQVVTYQVSYLRVSKEKMRD